MFMLCVRVGIESIKHTEEGRGGLLVYRFTSEKLGSGLVPSWLCAEKALCGRGFCFLRTLKSCLPRSAPQPGWFGQRLGETDVTRSLWPQNCALFLMAKGHR